MSITTTPLENLGHVDPNAGKYVDKTDKNKQLQQDFMKVLMAQLQYQDPMQPMQNNEFTAQVAQLTGLQQQQAGNDLLQQLVSSQQTDSLNQSVSYLGRQVVIEGNQTAVTGGRGTAYFELSASADATISIYNQDGSKALDIPSAHYEAGVQSVNFASSSLADGTYTIRVTPRAPPTIPGQATGTAATVTLLQQGLVTGVSKDTSGIMLNVGGNKIPTDQVRLVS